jgi:hypothetical protein
MATATKSKMYYTTRTVVRVVVKVLLLLVAYAVLHLAASSIWNALLFAAVVGCGFLIHDYKTKQSVQE